MPGSNILKSKMAERGITAYQLAANIGLSNASFSRRMNGGVPFRADEIRSIKDKLSLSPQEVDLIFFR